MLRLRHEMSGRHDGRVITRDVDVYEESAIGTLFAGGHAVRVEIVRSYGEVSVYTVADHDDGPRVGDGLASTDRILSRDTDREV